ncbi:transposase [Streptomyces sp900116325]|uniref:Transposase n=1 Tax=Streptomyces sp. 900116325 TaxID=3154295 RepID=A0ABV2UL37_9ACTN
MDDRTVLHGIVWKFRTGVAWRDAPEQYGPWATLHTRFRRWALDGTFERMLQAAQARADAAEGIDWLVSVDSTVVRAHQHAAGARNRGLSDGAFTAGGAGAFAAGFAAGAGAFASGCFPVGCLPVMLGCLPVVRPIVLACPPPW